ncbi:MAG: thiamine pyrophosphate-dependent enzyme [Bacteroidota bacterium]|jgi:pyruvate/2-oxoglutarate/acetoin dehydrogenase E1 component/TPP-dependent pyruvate/acetoin dehydrogenase alpha subunit
MEVAETAAEMSFPEFREEVIRDYRLAFQSRQASLIGRKEVLTGKAKFGIFGDGKELAQIAMAKVFAAGDYRSGYYRDQTFMFATGMSDIRSFFAQLYAHPSTEAEPASGGRSMNGHFATRMLDDSGNWLPQNDRFNSTADISPTGSQMPRLLGLALASKIYRENEGLKNETQFSQGGSEVAFGTIGNASSSEGMFWEVMNAACVMQVPLAISVWDDGYGISVPAKYQTAKENISALMKGFQTNKEGKGLKIFTARGWDYPALCETYRDAISTCRKEHTPVLIHITEMTQPQGHSTSGSHERYKSPERLQWEQDYDCIARFRTWITENEIATSEELEALEAEYLKEVRNWQKEAWNAFLGDIKSEVNDCCAALEAAAGQSAMKAELTQLAAQIQSLGEPGRKDIGNAIHKALRLTLGEGEAVRRPLLHFHDQFFATNEERYSSHLHSHSAENALQVPVVAPDFSGDPVMCDGREVLQACFDANLARDPRVFAFGEDLGKIGDVNQGFAGLQEKYGELRVGDRGIREVSIVGEGIGAAMRGLRPIAEIQYLDYLLYALQIMSDDIATVQYRTKGGQKAPVIVRTRGHRLEGIWHSGSPMGMIISALRGMYVCVPRNMTQAAGMYNTLLRSDEPGLVIECLNGYRLKEQLPANIGEFTVPFGVPEVIREGSDLTLVTYGSCCRIASEAAAMLAEAGIEVEIVDVQTLLPFDRYHRIADSIRKTNRVLFLDEDVPGGASAYMLQQVVEVQGAWRWLDSAPSTLAAKPHRPAYGTDGDYFSKPSVDDVFRAVYNIMHEANPGAYPAYLG